MKKTLKKVFVKRNKKRKVKSIECKFNSSANQLKTINSKQTRIFEDFSKNFNVVVFIVFIYNVESIFDLILGKTLLDRIDSSSVRLLLSGPWPVRLRATCQRATGQK